MRKETLDKLEEHDYFFSLKKNYYKYYPDCLSPSITYRDHDQYFEHTMENRFTVIFGENIHHFVLCKPIYKENCWFQIIINREFGPIGEQWNKEWSHLLPISINKRYSSKELDTILEESKFIKKIFDYYLLFKSH